MQEPIFRRELVRTGLASPNSLAHRKHWGNSPSFCGRWNIHGAQSRLGSRGAAWPSGVGVGTMSSALFGSRRLRIGAGQNPDLPSYGGRFARGIWGGTPLQTGAEIIGVG
jgi:hypothetical protein